MSLYDKTNIVDNIEYTSKHAKDVLEDGQLASTFRVK